MFDREPFRYQQFISDLNGADIKIHANDPTVVIETIRDWLSTASRRSTIPDALKIQTAYQKFTNRLQELAAKLSLPPNKISFNDFCLFTEEVVRGLV